MNLSIVKKVKINLTTKIFIGMALGIALGVLSPALAQKFQLISDIFLRLVKMIIAPLVFATLVVGIAKMGDFKALGRVGAKTLAYFYFATIISIVLGLVLVNLFEPGKMMQIPLPASLPDAGIEAESHDFKSFIYRSFPVSIVDSMAKNEILPVVIFSLFFGLALSSVKEKGKPIFRALESLSEILFKVTGFVMYFAPFAVFGAMAAIIGKEGLGILSGYLYLISCFYGGLIFFAVVILGAICYFSKVPYFKLVKAMKEPLLTAFGTATSESAFPQTMEKLEKFGCPNKIVSFVLPMGYSFNLDAAMMNMTFATMFIAQVYGIEIGFDQQVTMVLMLLLASKGIAGVPRASLIVVAGLLGTFGIPAEGLLLLLGIDHILDMGRSAVNLFGNAVATCVICKWEGELDVKEI